MKILKRLTVFKHSLKYSHRSREDKASQLSFSAISQLCVACSSLARLESVHWYHIVQKSLCS